ncbi:unnamed protein product [Prorocentrum cordatum]|uniref:Uncharacterized protein n=1 Tax=Prorocentrum cordatum TaxID=2364126 RepID=A0ABN9RCD4_9DINO|nr:unnamed protein product [Polarella glacialis]
MRAPVTFINIRTEAPPRLQRRAGCRLSATGEATAAQLLWYRWAKPSPQPPTPPPPPPAVDTANPLQESTAAQANGAFDRMAAVEAENRPGRCCCCSPVLAEEGNTPALQT